MGQENYSRPFVQREVTLYTQSAKNAIEYLRDIDRAFSRAYKFCHQCSSKDIGKLDSLMDNILRTLENDIEQGIKELDSRCAEARAPSLSYSKPFNKTVQITHPGTFRFIDLILSFDTLLRLADKLHFAMLVDDSEHVLFQKNLRIKLMKLKRDIEELATWKKITELFKPSEDSVVAVHPETHSASNL